MGDYLVAIFFWLVYEAFSWPLRLALQPAPMSPDVRRMLSRVVGPLLICMVSWKFSHFFIPLGFVTIWLWFAAAFGAAVWSCRRLGHTPDWRAVFSPVSDTRNRRREWIVEGIGFATFFAFLYFRRLAPEMTTAQINAGIAAEKFDNAMIFWSSFYARWSPPDDYWMTGYSQAYYYFGHFFWAWIGRASLLPGEWVITLAITRLVVLVYESCYLLVRAFGARALSAAIGAFFIAWGGNPLAVQKAVDQYDIFTGRKTEAEDVRGWRLSARYREKALGDLSGLISGYDYWKPSRALTDGDITEYLAWTAILGDFHAHHLSAPWMIGFIAVVLAGDRWFRLRRAHCLARERKKRKRGEPEEPRAGPTAILPEQRRALIHRAVLWAASFLMLGVASTIANLWMAPMVGLISLGILFWRTGWSFGGLTVRTLLIAVLAAAMVAGIVLSRGTLSTPVDTEGFPIKVLPKTIRSTVPMLLSHWGFHLGIMMTAFVAMLVAGKGRFIRQHRILVGVAVGVFLLQVLWFKFAARNDPSFLWIGFTFLMACFAWGRRPGLRPLITAFICGSCVLLASFEVFFMDDPMGGSHERYNTYFKFSYPIWPLLGAAAWMCVQRLWYWRGFFAVRWGFRAAALALVPFVMTMAVWGFPRRTNAARWSDNPPREPTLNAVQWLEILPGYQAEARMLNWIRENIPPGTRIAESNDHKHGAYAYQGRVASLAGRPIPLGWSHHERIWRGFGEKSIDTRLMAVDALYNSATKDQVLAEAAKLGVEWIVIGKVEKEALGLQRAEIFYKAVREAALEWQGFPADKPEVHLFRLPPPPPEPADIAQ